MSKWFKGKELALALALNISISRLASVVNGLVIPAVYNETHTQNLGLALIIGFFICVFSCVSGFILSKCTYVIYSFKCTTTRRLIGLMELTS